jgi:hypothetical protein
MRDWIRVLESPFTFSARFYPTPIGTDCTTTTAASDARRSPIDAAMAQVDVLNPTCALSPVGTWDNITPPVVAAQLPSPGGPGLCTFDVQTFVLDPVNPAVIYLGSCQLGLWKSTDCGTSWAKINTGMNGDQLDAGREWSMAIDPSNHGTVYAVSGYNTIGPSTLYKSTNGGVDWVQMWPPTDPTVAEGTTSFVGGVSMDPIDPQHLL